MAGTIFFKNSGSWNRLPPFMPPHKISSVMHSYLAYITNRSFVFDDYIWSHGPFPYTVYDLEFRATRVPLNAFISGPIAGAPFFAPANSFPRAVHAKFWEAICPRERRHTILSADVPGDVWGTSRIQWWRDEIAKKENVFCLEVRQKPVFNFRYAPNLMFKVTRLIDPCQFLRRSRTAGYLALSIPSSHFDPTQMVSSHLSRYWTQLRHSFRPSWTSANYSGQSRCSDQWTRIGKSSSVTSRDVSVSRSCTYSAWRFHSSLSKACKLGFPLPRIQLFQRVTRPLDHVQRFFTSGSQNIFPPLADNYLNQHS